VPYRNPFKRTSHGIVPGLHVGEGERARAYVDAGFRIVSATIDDSLIEAGSRRDLDAARGRAMR
jgi:hypothetical protein